MIENIFTIFMTIFALVGVIGLLFLPIAFAYRAMDEVLKFRKEHWERTQKEVEDGNDA